jgi:hypothetical protein
LNLRGTFFLRAAQMCFCPLKRKLRPKPAMFFIARYKIAKNFPKRLLGILNESVLTIRIAAIVLVYKL